MLNYVGDNKNLFLRSHEEAIEEHQIVEEDDQQISSEGEGDDLLNGIEDDYRAVPELDNYEEEGIDDDDDYDQMDPEARQLAEQEINEREYLR